MKRTLKRILSSAVVLMLLCGLLSVSALAAEESAAIEKRLVGLTIYVKDEYDSGITIKYNDSGKVETIERDYADEHYDDTTTTFVYDSLNRLIKSEMIPYYDSLLNTAGEVTKTYNYDSQGRLLYVNIDGNSIDYTYNSENQIIKSEDYSNSTEYYYNEAGVLIKECDDNYFDEYIGITIHEYDDFGRRTKTTWITTLYGKQTDEDTKELNYDYYPLVVSKISLGDSESIAYDLSDSAPFYSPALIDTIVSEDSILVWPSNLGAEIDSFATDEDGYVTTICGYKYTTWPVRCELDWEMVGEVVDGAGKCEHEASTPMNGLNATCTATGLTDGTKCSVCGEVLKKQETIPALGHKFSYGKCSTCGAKDPNYVEPTPTPPEVIENPFADVPDNAWYAAPVLWAYENNVTGGTSATTFSPDDGCTRAQVVTFLWAANGKPEPTSMDNPFSDVADNAWYAKPVLWAVEQGITGGVADGKFGPEQTCTRAQIVTFLYAAAGKPEITATSTFKDVADTDWFAKPVIWAAENDVTGGIGDGKFGPNNTCTRAQVVTFLYKVYGNK